MVQGSSNSDSDWRKVSSRSSVVVLKRKTPRIDPWGQPPVTSMGSDHVEPTLTDMVLPDKKVASKRMTSVDAPLDANEVRQCWKDRRLKALE